MDGGDDHGGPDHRAARRAGPGHRRLVRELGQHGGYVGPDTITLHGAGGAISIAFNDGTPGPAHRAGPHSVYYQHPLRIQGGTGGYAGYTGSGTIDLNMNAAHTEVESITLNAQSK